MTEHKNNSAVFERQREYWQRQVNGDSKLHASTVKVALALSLYFNRKRGGEAWPEINTLATATAISRSTVLRAIKELEAGGHIRVVRSKAANGKQAVNRYVPTIKPLDSKPGSPGVTDDTRHRVSNQTSPGVKISPSRVSKTAPAGCHL
jgi:DNA-binding transcriptional MocR family regulator